MALHFWCSLSLMTPTPSEALALPSPPQKKINVPSLSRVQLYSSSLLFPICKQCGILYRFPQL